jgi:uracil-DNA glycosylase
MTADEYILQNRTLYSLNKTIFECQECQHIDRTIGYPCPMYVGAKTDFSILVVGQSPGVAIQSNDPIIKSYSNTLSFDEHNKAYHESMRNALIISFARKYLNLELEDLLWTNVCKCAYQNNFAPPIEDIEHGKKHLFAQIDLLKNCLKVIITLGKPAAEAFNTNITKYPIVQTLKYPIMALYHPSYINRAGLWPYIDLASKNLHSYLDGIKCRI